MGRKQMKSAQWRSWPTLCLVCGVDSGPIRIFLLVFMGALVLTSLCALTWAIGTKRVDGEEEAARMALDAETGKDP